MFESYSTRSVSAPEKLDFWNSLVGETYNGLVVDPVDLRFDAELWRLPLSNLTLVRPRSAGAAIARRRTHGRPAPSAKVAVHVMLKGNIYLEHRGRESLLGPGDMVACASEEYYRFTAKESHELLVVELERQDIADRVTHIDDIIGRRIPGKSAASRMVSDFMLSLWREASGDWNHQLSKDYASVLQDLILISLNKYEADDASSADPLLVRMRALIAARYSDSALTPAILAGELGVSMRALQLAAARAGRTPTACIEEHRMAEAARLLSNGSQQSIAQIAFACGFLDSGYFSQRFSRHFGVSPRGYRH